MYFLDRMRGIDTSKVPLNANFDMPVKRGRDGRFKVAPGTQEWGTIEARTFVYDDCCRSCQPRRRMEDLATESSRGLNLEPASISWHIAKMSFHEETR